MTTPKTLADLNIKNNNDIVASKIQIKSNLIKSIKRGDFDIKSKSRKGARKKGKEEWLRGGIRAFGGAIRDAGDAIDDARAAVKASMPVAPIDPTLDDVSSASLRSWANDIVDKVNSRITNTCLDVNGQAATNKQPCTGDATECRYKEKMHEHLRNPILRNILNPPAPNEVALPPPAGTGMVNKGLGWLRIPTSTANQIEAGWGANEGQQGFTYDTPSNYPEYSNLDASIDLLIANKFSREESIDIHNTLMHDVWSQEYPSKLSSGKNFIFTKAGHISIELPSGVSSAQSGTPKKIFLNPMTQTEEGASPTLMGILQQSCSGGACTQTYSMASDDQENGVFEYSAYSASNAGKQLLFAMGAKVVMNKALTYILYTPIAQNKLDELKQEAFDGSAGNVYYLLYNPIHQSDFKDFFRCHMQSTRSGSGSTYDAGASYYTAADTSGLNGIQDPYKLTDRTVQDGNEGCLDQLRTDPYNVYIARYCNAFKTPGLLSSMGNEYMTHFADPTCAFTMSESTAKFTFVTNYNVSDESRREKFYKRKRTETDRDGYDRFKTALTVINGSDYGLNIWACPGHPKGGYHSTIMKYLEDLNQYSSNSTTFVQDLGNAILNSNYNQWIDTGDGGGRREIQPGATASVVKCFQPIWKIQKCNMEVTSEQVEGTSITQNMACGPLPSTPGADQPAERATMTGDGATGQNDPPTVPRCRNDVFIPACADCVIAGSCTAGDRAIDTAQGLWQACCYHSAAVMEGDCPTQTTSGDCGDFGNTIQSSFHQDVRTAGEKERLETQVSTLYKKVALATEVATTSRNAYKDDPKIKKIVRRMMEDAVDAQGKLDIINGLVELMEGVVVRVETVENVENKISEVITIINRLEEDEGKLIDIIEENYINGIKKTYIFAGIAAFILLIVLVLVM